MKKYLLVLLIFVALLFSCNQNCDDEMNDVEKKYGAPEEVNSYSSDGYDSED